MQVYIVYLLQDKESVQRLIQALTTKKIKNLVAIEISNLNLTFFSESSLVAIWLTKNSAQWFVDNLKTITECRLTFSNYITLLTEESELPYFLKDKRLADFRVSFTHGLVKLLIFLGEKENSNPNEKISNFSHELLRDLERVVIPIPYSQDLCLVQKLKSIPRSGKQIRLHTYNKPIVAIRSIYDHILSLAHSADCLIPELEPNLSDLECQTISKCIVYHDLCEVLLGDIPSFTDLSSAITKNRVQLKSLKLLNRYKSDQRDNIVNEFIKMFLEEQEQNSMAEYQAITQQRDNKLFKIFHFLDKIDPIISIWRYLHQYKGKLGDVENFLQRLEDFFIYGQPKSVTKEYTSEQKVLMMVDNLMKSKNAYNYYMGESLDNIFSTRFSNNNMITDLIEGREIIFTKNPQTRKKTTISLAK
jgi:5'-deoxynucleotidase YfbR-like HD superfamily hydrolase